VLLAWRSELSNVNKARLLIARLAVALIVAVALPPSASAEEYHQESPLSVVRADSNSAQKHVERAVSCYTRSDLDCAVSELEQAKSVRPGDAQIVFMLGNAYYRRQNWSSSIAQYTEAARLRPDHPDTWLNLGFAHFHNSEFRPAVIAWKQAVKRSTKDPLSRMALAVGLVSLGQREEALEEFSIALDLRPDSCEKAKLTVDVRWQANALTQAEKLCRLIGR
jgi:cytochrome c-type biogenesis protein CcmH/NrfG